MPALPYTPAMVHSPLCTLEHCQEDDWLGFIALRLSPRVFTIQFPACAWKHVIDPQNCSTGNSAIMLPPRNTICKSTSLHARATLRKPNHWHTSAQPAGWAGVSLSNTYLLARLLLPRTLQRGSGSRESLTSFSDLWFQDDGILHHFYIPKLQWHCWKFREAIYKWETMSDYCQATRV